MLTLFQNNKSNLDFQLLFVIVLKSWNMTVTICSEVFTIISSIPHFAHGSAKQEVCGEFSQKLLQLSVNQDGFMRLPTLAQTRTCLEPTNPSKMSFNMRLSHLWHSNWMVIFHSEDKKVPLICTQYNLKQAFLNEHFHNYFVLFKRKYKQ